jgi:hypothetical protein
MQRLLGCDEWLLRYKPNTEKYNKKLEFKHINLCIANENMFVWTKMKDYMQGMHVQKRFLIVALLGEICTSE